MIGGFRGRGPLPIYHHIAENDCDGWRDVVLGAARAADELIPLPRDLLELHRLTAPHDSPTGDIDAAVMGSAIRLFEGGVLLGYALARTWPTAAEGLDTWARRAVALAGLATEEDAAGWLEQEQAAAAVATPPGRRA